MTAPPAECHRYRLSLSAAHDGGTGGDDLLAAEAHLLGCASCQAFRVGLRRLDDLVAGAELPPAPDVAARLTAVPLRRPGFDARRQPARSMLAVVAIVQLVVALNELLGAGDPAAAGHTDRHLGAWGTAFGVGLLLAAVRPGSARALMPLAATLAVGVVVIGALDLAAGRRVPAAEAIHALELAGVVLLAMVARLGDGYARWGRPPRALVGSA